MAVTTGPQNEVYSLIDDYINWDGQLNLANAGDASTSLTKLANGTKDTFWDWLGGSNPNPTGSMISQASFWENNKTAVIIGGGLLLVMLLGGNHRGTR